MSFGEEKRDAEHVNQTTGNVPVEASIQEYTPAEAKKIIRRVDRRLVTVLGLLYMCSLMDRTNVGIAKIAGSSFRHFRIQKLG
jgi:hypothetical protein